MLRIREGCRARPGGDAAAGRRAGRDGRDGKLDGMPSAGGDVLRARFRRRRLVLVRGRRLGLGFNRFGASFADLPSGIPLSGTRGRQNVQSRARSKPRPKRRPRSSTESGHAPLERPRDEPVLGEEGTRRRDDRAFAGRQRTGRRLRARSRRSRRRRRCRGGPPRPRPAAEATRREDVGDAAEPSHDGDAKEADGEADRRKAQLDTELEREVNAAACASPRQVCRRRRERWANRRTGRPRVPVLQAAARQQQTNIEEYFAKVKRPPPPATERDAWKRKQEESLRGESRGGLYGFAKKAHAFLVERAARASAALAALFLSRASRRRGRESTARMGKKKPNLPEDFA